MESLGPSLPFVSPACKPTKEHHSQGSQHFSLGERVKDVRICCDDAALNCEALAKMLHDERDAVSRFLLTRHTNILEKLRDPQGTAPSENSAMYTNVDAFDDYVAPDPSHFISDRSSKSKSLISSNSRDALKVNEEVLFPSQASRPSLLNSRSNDVLGCDSAEAHATDSMVVSNPVSKPKTRRIRGSSSDDGIHQSRTCLQARLRQLAMHDLFDRSFGLLILSNAVFMCVEAQYWGFESGHELGLTDAASNVWPSADLVFKVVDFCFGVAFTCETIIKILGLWRRFIVSFWNWFDALVVLAWLINVLLESIMEVNPVMLRISRLARLIRILRLARALQVFETVHLLSASLSASMSVLFWSVALLVGIMTTCSLIMINVMQFYILDTSINDRKREEAFWYFGSFSKSLLSVFELTLGNWVPITRFLHHEVSEWFGVVLMVYHCIVSFAIVMVIRGVFLHETLQAAGESDDLMILRQNRIKAKTVAKMEALFIEADETGEGYLSHQDFVSVMNEPRVKAWLSAMGLEVRDAETVFDMVDDGDRKISAYEFVKGFTRLKGPARSLDMVQVLRLDRSIAVLLQEVLERLGTDASSMKNGKEKFNF